MADTQPDPQMLKGTLPLLILGLLRRGDSYGYQLVDDLRSIGLTQASSGTIYPLIARLEREGAIASYLLPSPSGPARKYYRLTDAGVQQLADTTARWRELNAIVVRALEPAITDETPDPKEQDR